MSETQNSDRANGGEMNVRIKRVRDALKTGADEAQNPAVVTAYYRAALRDFDYIIRTLAELTVEYAELAEAHGNKLRESA